MSTPSKKSSGTQTNATSSNSSATAKNASPAPSSSAGYPPPSTSKYKKILDFPTGDEVKHYAPAPDGGPPNGGLLPGLYVHDYKEITCVREPPLAKPTDQMEPLSGYWAELQKGKTPAQLEAEGLKPSDGTWRSDLKKSSFGGD